MKTLLVTTYYKDKVKERDDEFITCLRANADNKEIDNIIVLVDKGTEFPFEHYKITWRYVDKRPTYNSFFDIANTVRYGISIIANTDIYFDDYNIGLIKSSIKKDECYALSRWDVQTKGDSIHYNHRDSQDAWIFKGEIRGVHGDFFIGKPGCDNRIAHEISEAGYTVINPSKTIKSFHLHISGIRNYKRVEAEVIPPPYKLVSPTYLGERYEAELSIGLNGSVIDRSIIKIIPKLTEFSIEQQRKQASELLKKGKISKSFLLTVCIPSMHSRKKKLASLKDKLVQQMVFHGLTSKVQIKTEVDDGYAPIGWKRNKLNIECDGAYVIHLDCDDDIHPHYLPLLVKIIEENMGVDVITFNGSVSIDGGERVDMLFNITNTKNSIIKRNGKDVRLRMPCHLNAIRRERAIENLFPIKMVEGAKNRAERNDFGSDVEYSIAMVKNNTLKTNVHIDEILYLYNYKSDK